MSRPKITATTHTLPFDKLSPRDFERVCLWLVKREGWLRSEHLGEAGREQGRDVIAWKATDQGEQLWFFQCKRYKTIGASTLCKEVEKYNALPQTERPYGIVFVTNAVISKKTRDAVAERCRKHGYACEFWAHTELDERVKAYPDIVKEFFDLNSAPTYNALHQLPAPPPDFTGREKELNELLARLGQGVTISGMHGLGGVGKTALALKLAERIQDRCPDAQIYLDLQGAGANPLSPARAMEHVIRAYHPTAKLPESLAELSAIYRSTMHSHARCF